MDIYFLLHWSWSRFMLLLPFNTSLTPSDYVRRATCVGSLPSTSLYSLVELLSRACQFICSTFLELFQVLSLLLSGVFSSLFLVSWLYLQPMQLDDSLREFIKWLLMYLLSAATTLGGVWAMRRKGWLEERQQVTTEREKDGEEDRENASLYLQFKGEIEKMETRGDERIAKLEARHAQLIIDMETRNATRVADMEARHVRDMDRVKTEMSLVIDSMSYLCDKVGGEHPDWVATANEIRAGKVVYKRPGD